MANATDVGAERLDSWKAIADYLDRDVATVRRWEKSLNLPVRRVGGGRSVFAFRREIDDWLLARDLPNTPAPPDPEPRTEEPLSFPPAAAARAGNWRWKLALVTLVTSIAAVTWYGRGSSAEAGPMTVEVTASGVVARGAGGTERWRHAFPIERQVFPLLWQNPRQVVAPGADSVVVGTSWSEDTASRTAAGGQLLQLSSAGRVQRTFAFDDRIAFADVTYAPPWGVTDFRRGGASGASIAVAAHHLHWWPSVVTVVNREWKRTATFVHSGWIERLHWLSPDRLLAAGFSNARDGGMVALLDPATMNGQSPRVEDARFTCASCGPESPLRYIVFPRSELNRVTNSPFNRAQLEPAGDRLVLRTIEVPKEASPADALYELSPTLELLTASYGDHYWEIHRSLEAEGKIRHTREQCPERHGPRAIDVWEPATGWRTLRLR